MSTIQETINRLRELDQKASPAPWARTGTKRFSYDDIEPGDLLDGEGFELVPEIERVCPPVDAEMIAEARNAIPALLAEIDRLQSAERELKERFALIFSKWRSRRRDLIRRVQAEARAEGWDEGYQDKETEASESMIERGLRERTKNPYKENKK